MVAAAEPQLGLSEVALPRRDRRSRWQGRYLRRAAATDATAALASVALAWLLAAHLHHAQAAYAFDQTIATLVAAPFWLVLLAASGAYEIRVLGTGTDEYRRVMNAALVMLATTSTLAYLFRLHVARPFVLWAIPLAVAGTILGRYVLRKALHRRWAAGEDVRRTLLVGEPDELAVVAGHLTRESWAGFSVVGLCSTRPDTNLRLDDGRVLEDLGGPTEVAHAVEALAIDTLVVTSTRGLGAGGLRDLAWELEGSPVQLIVAPAVTDLTGPRIASRPVAGLPLLHVEEPRLSFFGQAFKAAFDRAASFLALLLLSPLMVAIAVAVKASSRGPVFYRQTRVGLNGEHFSLMKFRTMVDGADSMVPELVDWNEATGPLFKIKDDPRCTRVGRLLRRLSLDELPQLFQVLTGRMSIVGPRPPLPSEVATYDPHVHRKFLVKPGITGLWQVSGRSDLPWEESVRLDLHYVDNWSPTMDLAICLKTLAVVARRSGAY